MDVEDNSAFCEKIVNEIYAVFLKDPELAGFEIIPMPSNENKSPIVHIDHHLGVQSWCIKYIYEYSHKIIIKFKLDNMKFHWPYHDGCNAIIKYLNCAILINPDVSTFWNIRRQLFGKNRLDITKEFQFSSIVLSKKPKSNEAFSYRRWLYSFQSYESIDWAFEIGLCEKCADKSTTNYHAWCHRQWILQKAPDLLKFEIYKTEKFIRKHVLDYSCYNHRQFVLSKMFEYCYFDMDDYDYRAIREFIRKILPNEDVDTTKDIIQILVPSSSNDNANEIRTKSFLYCMNLAASDIKLCDDLSNVYGDSQAFENHRRFMLKFLVDTCRCAITNHVFCGSRKNFRTNCNQPLTKMSKYDLNDDSYFLKKLKDFESTNDNPEHLKWCEIFLRFDFNLA